MLDHDISSADARRLLSADAAADPDRPGPNGWTRRRFLQAVAAGAAGGAVAGAFGPTVAELLGADPAEAWAATPIGAHDGILVNVVLYGGNDGLDTVVPYTDGLYYDHRGPLALAADQVLALDGAWGLHPSLGYLKSRWDAGQVAVVHGVGYPDPNLSHFTSMATWMHGSFAGGVPSSGWIGRWHDGIAAAKAEFASVTIGSSVGLHLQGQNRRAIGVSPYGDMFGAGTDEQQVRLYGGVQALAAASGARGPWHDTYASVLKRQIDVAGEIAPVFATEIAEPTEFGRAMTVAARLVNANLGIRVIDVGLGGFDNHDNEPSTHAELLADLDAGLRVFHEGLDPAWLDRITIMTMSEFGRTPYANESFGTDHGTSSSHFVLGTRVAGGMFGSAPSLALADRWDRLPHTVDFRAVFGSVLDGWLGSGSSSVLNGSFDRLPLFTGRPG